LPGLTLVFIAAKLWHVIVWSWIWVLSPLWLPIIIIVSIVIIPITCMFLIALCICFFDIVKELGRKDNESNG